MGILSGVFTQMAARQARGRGPAAPAERPDDVPERIRKGRDATADEIPHSEKQEPWMREAQTRMVELEGAKTRKRRSTKKRRK